MKYNFDEIIDRSNTNSLKYAKAQQLHPDLPEDYIPMWVADMDFACPAPVLDAMKSRLDKRILGYSDISDEAYLDAVTGWMKRRHGWDVEGSRITFSCGVVPAMQAAAFYLTRPGDGIIMNTPAYHPFDDSIRKFGRVPVYNKLINCNGRYEIDFEDLEQKAKKPENTMFFFCSPHNPTGRVWTEEEITRVGQICFENNVFVFSDEIHSDLLRKGSRHIPFGKVFPEEQRIIVATAPSKTFNIAGNQLANLIMPNQKMAKEWTDREACGFPNPLSIVACIAAYNQCGDWLEELKSYLDESFRFMKDYLEKNMPKAKMNIPEGTYLAWVDLSGYGRKREDLSREIAKAGVFIEYENEFVQDGDGHVRINIACPRSILEEGLKRLAGVLGAAV